MSATSGRTSPNAFAWYDPDSRCLRTSQATFPWDSTPSSLTLPAWGTWDGTALYELPTSERAISAPVCSSLLPTPRTSDTNGAGAHGDGGLDLRTTVSLLPTPTAQASKHATDDRGPGTLDDFNLWTVARRLLPTPRVAADRCSRSSLTKDGHWSAPSLAQAVELAQGILPREYENWSEVQGWHGATTDQPSPDTQPSSDDQHPDQLTIWGALTPDSWSG